MFVEVQKPAQTWECKDCHEKISDQETLAYRLVNGILYGWCAECYARRHQPAAK